MVKFEFSLSDIDAENFIAILRDTAEAHHVMAMFNSTSREESSAHEKIKNYIEKIIKTILKGNRRIGAE